MVTKKNRTSFDIKSTNLSLVTFALKSNDLQILSQELVEQFGSSSGYFDDEPIVIDLLEVAQSNVTIDFQATLKILRDIKMRPFAVRNGSPEQIEAARAAGLIVAPEDIPPKKTEPEYTAAPSGNTMVIDKPLRSGQQVYARGCDLIITSMVSFGAEVIADGHIHVYAPLRGRIIAGAQGNTTARIFATCFEPELFSIAGVFQTTEKPLPPEILGKAVMLHLDENALIMTPIKTNGH